MNELKYYPCGYSGVDFLSTKGSIISHSEYLENGFVRLIECDKEEKSMMVKEKRENDKEWNEINMDGYKQGIVIDLSDKGDRWEGDSLNNSPFGYGCKYNPENQLIYKGFIFKGMKVCFGNEFFGDAGIIEYEGEYYKNMRFGYGRSYDKKSNLLYEGEWLKNQPMKLVSISDDHDLKDYDIHYNLENCHISYSSVCKLNILRLSHFPYLKSIDVSGYCISESTEIEIDNCSILTDINLELKRIERSSCHSIKWKGKLTISNCLVLKQLILKCDKSVYANGTIILKSIINRINQEIDLPALKSFKCDESDLYELDLVIDSKLAIVSFL